MSVGDPTETEISSKPLSAFAIRKLLRTSSNTSRESKSYSEKGSRVTESHKDVVDFPFESLDSSRTTKRRKFRTSSENVIEGRNAEKSLNSGCNNGTAHKAIVPRTPNGDRRRSNPLIGLHRSSLGIYDSRDDLSIQRCSTFIPSVDNVLEDTENAWTIRLENGETVTLIGQYELWVRVGTISVLGALLHASPQVHRIYAPSTHSLPLRSLTDDPYQRVLNVVENYSSWQASISRLGDATAQTRTVLIAGPKGSGKSTFVRLLINSLLTRPSASSNSGVALLDLDPGQPEFLPPGEISLFHIRSCILSPPFTHPAPNSSAGYGLIKSHHVGCTTPKHDPEYYIQCATDLIMQYKLSLASHPFLPLVINSCGWVLGSGLEILIQLVKSAILTDLVYTSATGPEDVVETLGEVAEKARIMYHVLDSLPDHDGRLPAADLRLIQTLSYFHLGSESDMGFLWNATPLASRDLLKLPYGDAEQTISGIIIYGDELDSRSIHDLLLGSVLGVVAVKGRSGTNDQGLRFDELNMELDHGYHIDQACSDDDVAAPMSDSGVPNAERSQSHNSGSLHMRSRSTIASLDVASILRATEYPFRFRRTDGGLPYMFVNGGSSLPFQLSQARSIGQVLIHEIDTEKKLLRVSSPVANNALQLLCNIQTQVFLVRARLETPTWAYAEVSEFVHGNEKRSREIRMIKGATGSRSDDSRSGEGSFDLKAWGINVPWTKVSQNRQSKQRRDKVWRSRRNLHTRDSAISGDGSH
ncbi:MAG: Polynucleotide 5'-hydroxyl-kinase grc3 [Icmadophila ericetorum]|nr:Polynucleotide 5'-hydroxyl-kinase grc3 [Icmadophila ericetorum]